MSTNEKPAVENREEAARRYQRIRRWLWLAGAVLNLVLLMALLASGASQRLRDFALAFTPREPLALLIYLLLLGAVLRLPRLPLSFYGGFRLEHRFGLSKQTLGSWAKDHLKALVLGLALAAAGTEWIYFALRRFPNLWWLLSAAVFVLFFIALAHLAPILIFPLFFKFKPLENEVLLQRLLRLSERAGTRVRGVWEWKLSEKSRRSNAALVGWGRTRRIILADTLLEGYSHDEIESILAHELGHHVHNHIWKGMALETALTFAGFFLLDRVLAWGTPALGFRGAADFANLPLLMLVGSVLSLLVMPFANGFSRHMERQADDYALGAPIPRSAYISAMEKLEAQNLLERQPHPLIEFLFYSHPSTGKRIARARQVV